MEGQQKMKDKVLHRLLKTLPMLIVLAVLAVAAVWISRSGEDGTATDSGRMIYAPAKVTAVLSDNAQEDFENAEGRRVGNQELEIQILSGDHKDEIMTVTNYMSALFNVDVQQGDRIIVRIMTDENGSYYASVFNYDRGIVLGTGELFWEVSCLSSLSCLQHWAERRGWELWQDFCSLWAVSGLS